MANEFIVHCLFCGKKWTITSRFETDWEFVHCYTYCGTCRKTFGDYFDRQMNIKQLPPFNPPRLNDNEEDDCA